jgi:hypothetical protein
MSSEHLVVQRNLNRSDRRNTGKQTNTLISLNILQIRSAGRNVQSEDTLSQAMNRTTIEGA